MLHGRFVRLGAITSLAVGLVVAGIAPAGAAPGDEINVVSVSSTGAFTRPAGFLELGFDGNSTDPAVSADGRYSVFTSFASDLVAGDTNFKADILFGPKGADVFRHDRITGETVRISLRDNEREVRDANSGEGQVSADGNLVAFVSNGFDIGVTPPGGGGRNQVYLRNVAAGTTVAISNPQAPTQGISLQPPGSREPSMSDDGSVIAFVSDDKLVPEDECAGLDLILGTCTLSVTDTYVWRAGTGSYEWLRGAVSPRVSRNGEWITFVRGGGLWRRNLTSGAETRVDVSAAGANANAVPGSPSISSDGNVVAWQTKANNLGPADTNQVQDVYVKRIAQNEIRRISVSPSGQEFTQFSFGPVVSANGASVAFGSQAPLLPGAANNNVFVHDLGDGNLQFASQNFLGGGAGGSTSPDIDANGQFVVFESTSNRLVDGDDNGNTDIYQWDRFGLPAPLAIGPLVFAAADGGVFTYGGAQFFGSLGGLPLNAPIVGVAQTPSNGGYWLLGADGGVFAFGDAKFFGSLGGVPLNQPVVGIAPTTTGNGYYLVSSDGGIFAFGDAQFSGSLGGIPLNSPIVRAAASPAGGYYLVALDGGIFAFGGAPFFGSLGGVDLVLPILSISPTPDGGGYYLVALDGGVFTFGNAQFFGSSGGTTFPWTVGLKINPQNNGYRLVQADGTVLSFTAGVLVGGANTGQPLNQPVVAVG